MLSDAALQPHLFIRPCAVRGWTAGRSTEPLLYPQPPVSRLAFLKTGPSLFLPIGYTD